MAAKKTSATPSAAKALKIACSKDGFWRAGRQWFREPVIVPLADLDNKQLALITKEPKLTVEHVDLPADSEE
jgi:hypothetical protein